MKGERKINRARESIASDKYMQRVLARATSFALRVRDKLLVNVPEREAGEVKGRIDPANGDIVSYFRMKEGRDVYEVIVHQLEDGSEL